jgi:hypothetical protein
MCNAATASIFTMLISNQRLAWWGPWDAQLLHLGRLHGNVVLGSLALSSLTTHPWWCLSASKLQTHVTCKMVAVQLQQMILVALVMMAHLLH